MTSCKGLCLVIKHASLHADLRFKEDIVEIKKLFSEELPYRYKDFCFTKSQELKDKIREKLKRFKSYHKQIVTFIFCHGIDKLFQTDDGTVTFDEIFDLYLQDSQISKIPKLFYFIQKEIKLNSWLPWILVKIKKVFVKNENDEKSMTNSISDIDSESDSNVNSDSESDSPVKVTPAFQKFYLEYLIVPDGGFCSLIRRQYGTLYVQTLLKAIKENPELTILEIGVIVGDTCNMTIESFHCLHDVVRFERK